MQLREKGVCKGAWGQCRTAFTSVGALGTTLIGVTQNAYASKISKFNFLYFLMQFCAMIIMLQTKVS